MGDALQYLGQHLLGVTFPMALGVVILIITFRRWLNKQR
jgi:hypothetical protein